MRTPLYTAAILAAAACVPTALAQEGITGLGSTIPVEALSADGTVGVGGAALRARMYRKTENGWTTTVLGAPPPQGWIDRATAVSQDGVHVFGYSVAQGGGQTLSKSMRWSPPYTTSQVLEPTSCATGIVPKASQLPDASFVTATYSISPISGPVLWGSRVMTISSTGALASFCVQVPGWSYEKVRAMSDNGQVLVGDVRNFDQMIYTDGTFVWEGTPGSAGVAVVLPASQSQRFNMVSADGMRVFGSMSGAIVRWALSDGELGPAETFLLPAGFSGIVTAVNADGSACFGQLFGIRNELFWWREGRGIVLLNTDLPGLGIDLTGWTLTTITATSADGQVISGLGTHGSQEGYILSLPRCGTADFNCDGDTATDQDIEAFFACLGGNCSATCFPGGSDFNRDGDSGTDQDIESFFRVLGGGSC